MVFGVQCDVDKFPHAVVRRTLSRGKAEISVTIIPYSPDLAPSYFFLFPKMKEHLAGNRFGNDEDLKDAIVTWMNSRRPQGMKRVYANLCQGTSALMSKATVWKGSRSYVPKLVYSVSELLLKNILTWRNVLYFQDVLRILHCILYEKIHTMYCKSGYLSSYASYVS